MSPGALGWTVTRPGADQARAHRDAVDPALQVKIEVVGRIELPAVPAPAPGRGPDAVEIPPLLEGRAALAPGVHGLDVDQRDIGAVGLPSARAGDRGQAQRDRRSHGVDGRGRPDGALAIGDRLEFARLPRDRGEGEEIMVGHLAVAERPAVQEKLHVVAVGHDVHRLVRARRVVPVPDDVRPGGAVEHDGADIVGLLGQAHAVDLAAVARGLAVHPAPARRVGKYPVGPAGMGGAPQLVDVLRHLVDGELLRIKRLVNLPGGPGIAEIRRRFLIPDAPGRFLAIATRPRRPAASGVSRPPSVPTSTSMFCASPVWSGRRVRERRGPRADHIALRSRARSSCAWARVTCWFPASQSRIEGWLR